MFAQDVRDIVELALKEVNISDYWSAMDMIKDILVREGAIEPEEQEDMT